MYAGPGLIGTAISYFMIPFKDNPLNGPFTMYCSEFIQECDEIIPIDYSEYFEADNTSPKMIAEYPLSINIDLS